MISHLMMGIQPGRIGTDPPAAMENWGIDVGYTKACKGSACGMPFQHDTAGDILEIIC